METRIDRITFLERDPAPIKYTRERGRITVIVGGDRYVLMDGSNKSEFFAAYSEKDAFYIEFVAPEEIPCARLFI